MAGYFERGLGARIYGEHREHIGLFNLLEESGWSTWSAKFEW